MLTRSNIPGLFITGTDTGVGKTVIAAAIASSLKQSGQRVAVRKPAATGCVHRREGLVSEDAEFLAHHADSPDPLDLICPQRFAEPLAPSVAAERAGTQLDWSSIDRSLKLMSDHADVMIVEGVGGVMVPMDEKHFVVDMARWLGIPAIVVARAGLGTINHTLLSIKALKDVGVRVAGVVINQYPSDGATAAEETNPRQIEKLGKAPVLCLVPQTKEALMPVIPAEIMSPISRVDWLGLAMKK